MSGSPNSGGPGRSGDPTRISSDGGSFSALPSGTRLDGRYVIESVIAAGGFGITYLARHEALTDVCAIKEHFPRQFAVRHGSTGRVTATDEATFRWALDRFLGEGRSLVRCKHPNVVAVKDIFEANGTAYLVLAYEEGLSLKAWLDGLGRPPTQAQLDRILAPLLDALEYIHAQGLMHRDIAPDNILIRPGGDPCLIDFGSARQAIAERSQVMSAIIKSGFSPPEQYTTDARAQGPWTDIYALAATIYRAMTGGPPPEATNRASGIEMPLLVDNRALQGNYRATFLSAIDHALRLRTVERPRSIAEWRAELLHDQARPTVVAPPPTSVADNAATRRPDPRTTSFTELPTHQPKAPSGNSSAGRVAIAALIGLIVVASAGFGGWKYWEGRQVAVLQPIPPPKPGPLPPLIPPPPQPPIAQPPTVPPPALQPKDAMPLRSKQEVLGDPDPQPAAPAQPQVPPPTTTRRDPGRLTVPGSGQHFVDQLANGGACSNCPELLVVPAGSFTLGSPSSEPEREGWIKGIESPTVRVTIPRPFAVGRYSVTFDEWDACVADGGCGRYRAPDSGWGRGIRPVINVSWIDAKSYIEWLSRRTGQRYRLLTDTEREYVARATTSSPYWFGRRITVDDANYDGNYVYAGGGEKGIFRARTVPVDSFQPNPWGLYNVHGNVWEWVEDCWNTSYSGHSGRPDARLTGDCTKRGRRGGSWNGVPWAIRAAHRAFGEVTERSNGIGFRVARDLN